MGVSPFVNNLYQDLKDGLVLLQVHVIVLDDDDPRLYAKN